MNYREKIRKAIECPQFGNTHYGEWGALRLEQRKLIKRLLDELEGVDIQLKKIQQENEELKDNWNELKKWLIENEQKSWDEVSRTFDYVLDKMQELEKGKSE